MIEALKIDDGQDEPYEHSKKATVYLKSPQANTYRILLYQESKIYETVLNYFPHVDPDVWHDRDSYKHARETLQSLRI